MTWFFEQQERWKEALEWYQRAPQHIEEWAGIARAKAGEMHWRLQNYSLAEDSLKRELRAHKNNDTAKNVLHRFADDYYKKLTDKESATRVYREILEVLGDSYLADYHNFLGNMSYFYGDYTQAAKEYLAAIAAKPDDPLLRRNLSEAYKELKNYSQARQSLEEAFRIDNDSKTLDREMALVVNAEGNNYYAQGDYRRAIELYTQAIEVDASNEVIHSNLGGAWEQLREPGKRLEALDKAIEAYERAHNVKATEKYERDIARLQRKKEYALRYGEKAIDWLHVVTPIAVEVAKDLIPLTEGGTGTSLSEHLSKHLTEMKARVQNEFGVRIPGVRFRGNETDLPPGTYLIMINEIPLVMGTLELHQRFFPGSAETLTTLGVEGKEANNPLEERKDAGSTGTTGKRSKARGYGTSSNISSGISSQLFSATSSSSLATRKLRTLFRSSPLNHWQTCGPRQGSWRH